MGWESKVMVEWDQWNQQVLRKNFPDAHIHGDITTFDATPYAGTIDLVCGGFPCQPYSTSGKRLGKADERHLWPQMLRVIREVRPAYVVGENVGGLLTWNAGLVFDEVQTSLEAEGYEVQSFVLPACGVNAPHRRDQVWIIAHRTNAGPEGVRSERTNAVHEPDATANAELVQGQQRFRSSIERRWSQKTKQVGVGRFSAVAHANRRLRSKRGVYKERPQAPERHTGSRHAWYDEPADWEDFPTQSPLCAGNDGLSARLVRLTYRWQNRTIKAGGNAIVPQVVYQVFQAIEQTENAISRLN